MTPEFTRFIYRSRLPVTWADIEMAMKPLIADVNNARDHWAADFEINHASAVFQALLERLPHRYSPR